ncbi:MAG: cytidine deaminase [Archangium sp.]|nr:cytidine deaminase [Archangium sp.]
MAPVGGDDVVPALRQPQRHRAAHATAATRHQRHRSARCSHAPRLPRGRNREHPPSLWESGPMRVDWQRLFEAAEAARQRAHAPYSNFHVGAALLLDDATLTQGCNVENASYGLTVCAERNAVAAMVLAGRTPLACAIVVDSDIPTPPCGVCRQVLAEFAGPKFPVRSRTVKGKEARYSLGALLPHTFTRAFLKPTKTSKR